MHTISYTGSKGHTLMCSCGWKLHVPGPFRVKVGKAHLQEHKTKGEAQ